MIKKHKEENLASLSREGILRKAQTRGNFFNQVEVAAEAEKLAETNQFGLLAPDQQREFIRAAEKMGNIQSILNNRPELAAQTMAATPKMDPLLGRVETRDEAITRAIQEATRKIKTSSAEQISHESLGNWRDRTAAPTNEQVNVAFTISNPQLTRIGNEGDAKQTEAFRNTIRQISDQYTAGTLTLSVPQQERLTKIIEYLDDNQHWQSI